MGTYREAKWSMQQKRGGQEDVMCRKPELAQMRVGRRLLGESNTVAGEAVQGDLGCRKLEERKEEMKVFGKRLEGMEESRLVKMVVEKLREARGIRWWAEYEILWEKFELDNEVTPVGRLKKKIRFKRTGTKYIRKAH